MTALGGPLILLAIVAVGWAFVDVLRGMDAWLFGGEDS
ncbi:hypothetical protein ART_1577 [Arthrobacter sp. PAMC 25486]|nr:hypothetical protein ART_1577 [Arthrobacter sp. PAMC 25486]